MRAAALRAVVFKAAALVALAVVRGGQAGPPPPGPPPAAPPAEVAPPPPPAPAASPYDAVAPVPRASAPLRARPTPGVVDAYRADPDFQYDRPQAEGPSLWDLFWDWVRRTIWGPIDRNTTADFWTAVLVVGAVLALGWVVARLVGADGGGVFARRQPAGPGAALLDAEDIAEVDLGARLAAAVGRGDLREAVRVRYLLVLQALDAAGAVAWRRDKTNREYVAEVARSRADLAPAFRSATRVFDAVWYGERPVPAEVYADLGPLFDRAGPQAEPRAT